MRELTIWRTLAVVMFLVTVCVAADKVTERATVKELNVQDIVLWNDKGQPIGRIGHTKGQPTLSFGLGDAKHRFVVSGDAETGEYVMYLQSPGSRLALGHEGVIATADGASGSFQAKTISLKKNKHEIVLGVSEEDGAFAATTNANGKANWSNRTGPVER